MALNAERDIKLAELRRRTLLLTKLPIEAIENERNTVIVTIDNVTPSIIPENSRSKDSIRRCFYTNNTLSDVMIWADAYGCCNRGTNDFFSINPKLIIR